MPTAVYRLKKELRTISEALEQLRFDEGFSRWALIALLKEKTKLPKGTIVAVVDGLEELVDEAFEEDKDST